MPRFKNVRVKMANGKSRLQRAQVLASGKLKFVKNIGRKAKSGAKRAGKRARKAVSRRKRSPSRAPVRKSNSKRSNNKSMVGLGSLKRLPIISNPTVKKIFIAAGAASIIVTVLSLISPRAAELANSSAGRGVIGFATGDFIGGAANIVLPMLVGRAGGGGNGANAAVRGTEGFA